VKPLSDARTPHGNRRVSARRGRAGEKSDFFNSLLGGLTQFPQEEYRLEEKSTR